MSDQASQPSATFFLHSRRNLLSLAKSHVSHKGKALQTQPAPVCSNPGPLSWKTRPRQAHLSMTSETEEASVTAVSAGGPGEVPVTAVI